MEKKAVVVGATSGIGKEVADLLWQDGWTVGVAGRRSERLEDFCKKSGCRAEFEPIDVTQEDAGERMLALIDKIGGADLVVLVSGIGSQNRQLDSEIELRTVSTNAEGFVRMATAAFNYFKIKGGGRIAAVTSIAGTKGLGIAPAYSATKRFQNTYMQCLAQLSSMEKANICFTDIRPGFVDTDLLKSGDYPMLLRPSRVAKSIVRALYKRRRVVVIDWRYRVLVALWQLLPNWLWERLSIHN